MSEIKFMQHLQGCLAAGKIAAAIRARKTHFMYSWLATLAYINEHRRKKENNRAITVPGQKADVAEDETDKDIG